MAQPVLREDPDRASETRRLGELLLERGLITDRDLAQALGIQASIGGRLGAILIRIGAVSEDQLLPVLAAQLGFPVLTIDQLPTDLAQHQAWLDAQPVLPQWWVEQRTVCWQVGDALHGVAQDPLDPFVNETLERIFGTTPRWHLMRSHELDRFLERLAFSERSGGTSEGQLRELAEEAPVVEFVNNMIAQATEQGASDIHLAVVDDELKVRFRVDGLLSEKLSLPRARLDAIASRIKLISGMDIAERRLPQDGRIRTRVIGQELDIRVSVLPSVSGEAVVLRLLPTERAEITLASLGLAADQEAQFKELAASPNGIILVTGPTGSGKSTTLYAMLNHVNGSGVKIITVEDPVEYEIDGITQVQTLDEIGLSFARVLRSSLRQDPDVLMVGEIRDLETAQIAIQASLTGHLVLSTLHTNDAASAFVRLVDIGVDAFLVATPLRAVIAQRLVRRLCEYCALPAEVPSVLAERVTPLATSPGEAPRWRRVGPGCAACGHTGYRGRLGIFELLPVNAALREAILAGQSADEIARTARAEGFRSMRDDGLLKAARGLTSVDEVLRVTSTQQ